MSGTGIRKYTDDDRARVFLELQVNGGNVRRTARNTNVPEPTVRKWKNKWESEGPPAPEFLNNVAEQAAEFVEQAEIVRDEALAQLRKKLPDATPSALVATIGMLTDKLQIARGLATSRVEHRHALPSPDEMKELVQGFVRGAVEASQARHEEIIEAEIVEHAPLALPSAANKED